MAFTLEQARKLAGKTQRETARHLGVCRDTYRAIERNPENATVKQAVDLSVFFGIPYNDIIFVHTSTFSREGDTETA